MRAEQRIVKSVVKTIRISSSQSFSVRKTRPPGAPQPRRVVVEVEGMREILFWVGVVVEI